jgi:choline dehydrogenase-like flavoprotein
MATIDHKDPVVVIIGSGAGGGTVAHELTTQGVKCVVLEAGPHLTRDDYENDEWRAFAQMAWLDMRTTSGSWRVSNDFPNLPAWIVKAVGGSTTHWSGATHGSWRTSSRPAPSTATSTAPRCWTGR